MISPVLVAQTLPDDLQEILELKDIDDSQLAYLFDYLETPLNLNQCSDDDLLQLAFLEKKEVTAILNYRKPDLFDLCMNYKPSKTWIVPA